MNLNTNKSVANGKNLIFGLMLVLLLVLELLLNIYFGYQKHGFHEDEYYTYFSTNRSLGLYKPDREWQSSETIANEFMVLPGEGFNYSLVALVQSWDVHPPLYYFIFHTICSIEAGVLSKWTGIVTNLIAFVICYLLLWRIMERLKVSKTLQLIVLAFWGFNPMTISFNMFIRMYMWLTVFVLLCTLMHLRFWIETMDGEKAHLPLWKIWLIYIVPIMVVSYLGFLTQYFYMIFFFFMGVGTGLYLLTSKRRFVLAKGVKKGCTSRPEGKYRKVLVLETFASRLKLIAVYVVSCAAALGLAVISYPASASHIFSGYRGTGAIESFTDTSNFTDRLSFFVGLLDSDVFGGLLTLIMLFIVLVMLYLWANKDSGLVYAGKMSGPVAIITFAVVMYFIVVSKTGLLLGRTSNRYEMPVYGLIILLLFMDVAFCIRQVEKRVAGNDKDVDALSTADAKKAGVIHNDSVDKDSAKAGLWWTNPIRIVAVIIVFIPMIYNLVAGDSVLFLYPEDEARVAYAEQNSDIPVIIFFNDASSEKIWWLTDELLEYPEMYFMSESNTELITDETICTADELLVYIADNDNLEDCLQCILDSNPGLSSYTVVSVKDVWTLYRFE